MSLLPFPLHHDRNTGSQSCTVFSVITTTTQSSRGQQSCHAQGTAFHTRHSGSLSVTGGEPAPEGLDFVRGLTRDSCPETWERMGLLCSKTWKTSREKMDNLLKLAQPCMVPQNPDTNIPHTGFCRIRFLDSEIL